MSKWGQNCKIKIATKALKHKVPLSLFMILRDFVVGDFNYQFVKLILLHS